MGGGRLDLVAGADFREDILEIFLGHFSAGGATAEGGGRAASVFSARMITYVFEITLGQAATRYHLDSFNGLESCGASRDWLGT